jgi:hypothetical protein
MHHIDMSIGPNMCLGHCQLLTAVLRKTGKTPTAVGDVMTQLPGCYWEAVSAGM